MLLGPIASQSIGRDFKLFRSITKAHEPKHPEYDTNSLGTDVFDGSHVYSLAIIPEPISKVDTFDIELAELLAASSAGH